MRCYGMYGCIISLSGKSGKGDISYQGIYTPALWITGMEIINMDYIAQSRNPFYAGSTWEDMAAFKYDHHAIDFVQSMRKRTMLEWRLIKRSRDYSIIHVTDRKE